MKGENMAQKQGGKGKTSSPSRQASHKRGPARTLANQAKKIARHAKRMGLTSAQVNFATLSDPFFGAPRTRRPGGEKENRRPLPMAALQELPRNFSGCFVIAAGVVLEASPHSTDLHRAFSGSSVVPRAIVRRSELGVLIPTETRNR